MFDRKQEGKEMGVLDPRLSHPNLDASLSVAIYVSTSSISQSRQPQGHSADLSIQLSSF